MAPSVTTGFIQFDKGKPFYDMVGTFLVALSASPAIFNADNPMNLNSTHIISMNGVLVGDKHLYPHEVFQQIQAGHITMPQFVAACCMMLANTSYESVKSQNDHSPEFEFFRHVRNASSHRNLFHFRHDEPFRPAVWRGSVFDHTRRGDTNPLQGKPCFGPILGPADLVHLLADIEAKLVG